jgi:hypothetical protein
VNGDRPIQVEDVGDDYLGAGSGLTKSIADTPSAAAYYVEAPQGLHQPIEEVFG